MSSSYPEIYQFVFGAPRPDQAKPARWLHRKETLNENGEATQFDIDAVTSQPQDLAPRTYCEVEIDARGLTTSGTVGILVGKWPVQCDAAFKLELGGTFNTWRKIMGYSPYTAVAGKDFAARKLYLRYDASGVMTVAGHLPALRYDLLASSKPGNEQQLNVLIVPEPGSTIYLRINGGAELPVKG